MTEPVHDMPPSVAVEVTDHDGEQVRIRPHRPDERGTVAALEYRHDGSDDWVHVVALDPDDLARLSDFARILVWASHPGDAAAELRAALFGSTPVASTDPGVSRGLFQSLPATWDRWSAATPAGGIGGLGEAARALRRAAVRYGRPADDVVFGPRDRFPGQLEEVTSRPVNVDSLNDLARVALMRVLGESGTAVHCGIGRMTACGEYLTGKVITRTRIRERVTCGVCVELVEFGGDEPAEAGVVHALGPDGALRGGCTLQVGDEAATTWSQGALRVTCPACRSALEDEQPLDVHLRSVAPVAPPLPVGVQRVGGERTIREDWQERRPGEPFPLDGYEELQGVPARPMPEGDDEPLAPPLTHAPGEAAETRCGISYADEPGIPLASDRGGVSCPACLAVGGER